MIAPVALILALWLVEQLRNRGIALWGDVGHTLEYSLVLLGPIVASATAFHTVREGRGALRELLETMPREGYLRDLALLSGELAWSVLVYLVLFVWLLAVTAPGASGGFPDLELVLAGMLGLGALASLGFLAGRLVPTYVTPPVVAVGMYLIVAATGVGESPVRFLSPLIDGEPNPLTPFPLAMGLFQSVWFGCLAVVGFSVGVLWRDASRPLFAVSVTATTLAVVAAVALVRMEPWFEKSVGIDYEPICERRSGVDVCLHPAYGTVVVPAAEAAGATLQPVVNATGWPSRVLQVGLPADARKAGTTQPDTLAFTWAPVGEDVAGGVTQSVAFAVVGFGTCDGLQPVEPVREGLAFWLINEASPGTFSSPESPFVRWLDSASVLDRKDWLQRNIAALRSCNEIPLPPGV